MGVVLIRVQHGSQFLRALDLARFHIGHGTACGEVRQDGDLVRRDRMSATSAMKCVAEHDVRA
jgi:hypothetical protein